MRAYSDDTRHCFDTLPNESAVEVVALKWSKNTAFRTEAVKNDSIPQ